MGKPMYAELHALSNFTFLRGASRPEELIQRATELKYSAIAITDECSLAGIVKAYVACKQHAIKLIIGSEFNFEEGLKLVLIAPDKVAYGELSTFISLGRRRSVKGEYKLHLNDLRFGIKHCLGIWLPEVNSLEPENSPELVDSPEQIDSTEHTLSKLGAQLSELLPQGLWLGVELILGGADQQRYLKLYTLAKKLDIPMVACGDVHMHTPKRKILQDTLTAIRLNTSVNKLGCLLQSNSERYLRPIHKLQNIYPKALLDESVRISERCTFSLDELRYCYPRELVPEGQTPQAYLRRLVEHGASVRWPDKVPDTVLQLIEKELLLIDEMQYEYYFLTVYDLVQFARDQKILCQGRGSAANSVVCYCLFITEISPTRISLLFERFISKEREEPPDIDVDFEHERREEVIQYIYKKYTRERAAIAATVITYRSRSAVRDVGKALDLDPLFVDQLAKSLAWWDRSSDLKKRFEEHKVQDREQLFARLVQEILGFPRHLSQHVGGFIITEGPVSQLVPLENASMPDRTVIQWDKEDIEALGLLKVDVLALGMLTTIRKCLTEISLYSDAVPDIQSIPEEDQATYAMLCRADSIGVFQIESRAQMSMLPRLRPVCFYDLVIEIAIVRPGPIQGNMVHPFLKRRSGIEPVSYPNDKIKSVLERTMGVPIFQEQVIKLAMVAAGFSGGEADKLRRAMASWGKNGNLLQFEDKLVQGMLKRGYSADFAHRLFDQIKGFGGYGFPESHSASFALLAYISAWMKCHHPAAFLCAILNSQPMGFYSPSQLVQDARRHAISVEPIDINISDWDHKLEAVENAMKEKIQPRVRLGLRLVKGFGKAAALRVMQQRSIHAFNNLLDLSRRAQLNKGEMEALANASAFTSFSTHRYQAHWQVLGIEESRPLLSDTESSSQYSLADGVYLSPPLPQQDMLADYQSTGLTIKKHPMGFLRDCKELKRCKRHTDLQHLNNGRFVCIAGLVTGRQRPGSASGVLFLTLEDETGNTNIVVWKSVQERFRQILLASKLLLVKGVMECKNEVIHVVMGEVIDLSYLLDDLAVRSRDFH